MDDGRGYDEKDIYGGRDGEGPHAPVNVVASGAAERVDSPRSSHPYVTLRCIGMEDM